MNAKQDLTTKTNPGGASRRRKLILVLLILVVIAAGVAWTQREVIKAYFYVHQLACAGESDRARWAERVASLGEAALPRLLDCWTPGACANMRAALDQLGHVWGVGDPRIAALVRRFGEEWPRLSDPGRRTVLEATAAWLRALPQETSSTEGLVSAVGELLAGVTHEDFAVQTAGLELCDCLAILPTRYSMPGPARTFVRTCLKAESPEIRLRAIGTAQRPGMDLSAQVAGLLADSVVEVRRAALRAVGPPDKDVLDETLLPCLHDEDKELRQLAEESLRDRGLTAEQLRLGRLLTHPHFLMRVQVLDELRRLQMLEEMGKRPDTPLDTALWLRRLSHDPMPSVRAAAARMMAQQANGDFADRLEQMARDDPSATVCYLAAYFQKTARARGAAE